ncbi:anaerobic ribonucleoside-triphosphate reductase activating protein [Veillonella sp. DNF00869]|uniref:anaerobic ribonucleoside-triphosphate reductase activating protein n=1 Tax=Veillonella sp. DNF00869 TaxID=1384081 RepID=UPI0007831A11|nr:anaerobic ribonucleoside-triphosphate reductase activating protein [Veillonella sp. DNF00869]
MRYGQLRQYDIANGEGIRTSLFVTGCTHGCYNCFNEEYQDFSAGEVWTESDTERLISYVSAPACSGLTLLGGEPFQNVDGLLPLVDRVLAVVPQKLIWVYSGYTYEEILACPNKRQLLERCHILVDGKFVDGLRDPALAFRGSSNQRIIDIQKSLQCGEVVLYME